MLAAKLSAPGGGGSETEEQGPFVDLEGKKKDEGGEGRSMGS